jgi:hypothetical protein
MRNPLGGVGQVDGNKDAFHSQSPFRVRLQMNEELMAVAWENSVQTLT